MSDVTSLASNLLSPLTGRGDWIPDSFKEVFKKEKGGVDFVLCHVFSKILYWHTPSRKGNKKFFGKEPHLSASDIAAQTGMTFQQAKRALVELENKYEFITRRRGGKRTYIKINVSVVEERFKLRCRQDDNKILVHCRSNDNEESYVGATTPTHIHKESHKEQNRKEIVTNLDSNKKQILEEKIESLMYELDRTVISEDYFLETCTAVNNLVISRLKHGDSLESILDGFLLNGVARINQYPAFARVAYIVNNVEALDELDMREINYKLKTECMTMPGILAHLNKYCPTFDQSVLKLDHQMLNDKALEEYCRIYDELAPLETELRNLENE